ncbi:MAG: DUF3782 domain-containing protein, partial [Gammaproteobacteria bacterium]|nr:DUF3782 domain-containing protein [Gammaproteobacteria bacterium]
MMGFGAVKFGGNPKYTGAPLPILRPGLRLLKIRVESKNGALRQARTNAPYPAHKWEENERRWMEEKAESERKWAANERQWAEEKAENKRQWAEERKERTAAFDRMHEEIMTIATVHKSSIGALGARWGIQSEQAFRSGLAAILEKTFGVKVENYHDFDDTGKVFGQPDQVE